jgi:hypothetical protein
MPCFASKSQIGGNSLADNSPDIVCMVWANDLGDVVTLRAALAQRAQQNRSTFTNAKGTEISGDSEASFGDALNAAQSAM